MNFRALATDYDGTIAWHGTVEPSTIRALERWKESGRTLLMVTGREIHDLLKVFSEATLFDLIVAENGALIYQPATKETRALAPCPSREFVEALRQAGVHPLSVGNVIVATQENYYGVVLQIITELALDLQIIMNKGALMILPAQINKATGLIEALYQLNIPAGDVVGVGDAENDFVFLELCGFSAAVANSVPGLKSAVSHVTRADHGAGVEELLAKVLAEDAEPAPNRRQY
jgi:hydroxymethylpyrimidine pyrophosphatase-like HAD family hydrolase